MTAAVLPSKPAPGTLWRWVVNGFPVGGRVVRLRCVWVGRKMFTTPDWLEAFIDRLTAARTAQEMCRAGGRDGRRWREFIRLAEADIVPWQAGLDHILTR